MNSGLDDSLTGKFEEMRQKIGTEQPLYVCLFKIPVREKLITANYFVRESSVGGAVMSAYTEHALLGYFTIVIFIFQNKQLQPTIITIRQPENRMINKAGCLILVQTRRSHFDTFAHNDR